MALKRFDAYEIHPVYEGPKTFNGIGQEVSGCCEQMDDEASAIQRVTEEGGRYFFTLYGHTSGEGLETVSDCTTRKDAEGMLYRITGITAQPDVDVYQLEGCATAPSTKLYPVRIVWGESRDTVEDYAFESARALEAFLNGVEEGNGWMEYEAYFPGEDGKLPEVKLGDEDDLANPEDLLDDQDPDFGDCGTDEEVEG